MFLTTLRFYFNISIGQDSIRILTYAYIFYNLKTIFYETTKEYDMTNNINILYEDTQILVCVKPAGVATQSKRIGSPDMVSLLKNHISKTSGKSGEPYLAVIHRLDQPVSGILVFAKTPAAAKALNRQLTTSGFGKHYYALVCGTPEQPSADLENYLVKDARTNTSRVCQKGTADAKLAKLHYDLVDTTFFANIASAIPVATSQLKIKLDTGRHHQIRVQLSGMGCPIIGDTKYNPDTPKLTARRTPLCLCAYQLEFSHPVTKKAMTFSLEHYI